MKERPAASLARSAITLSYVSRRPCVDAVALQPVLRPRIQSRNHPVVVLAAGKDGYLCRAKQEECVSALSLKTRLLPAPASSSLRQLLQDDVGIFFYC